MTARAFDIPSIWVTEHLQRREAILLELLLRHPNDRLPKERLYNHYVALNPPEKDYPSPALIECKISNLRKKLLPLGIGISSKRYWGYRLEYLESVEVAQ